MMGVFWLGVLACIGIFVLVKPLRNTMRWVLLWPLCTLASYIAYLYDFITSAVTTVLIVWTGHAIGFFMQNDLGNTVEWIQGLVSAMIVLPLTMGTVYLLGIHIVPYYKKKLGSMIICVYMFGMMVYNLFALNDYSLVAMEDMVRQIDWVVTGVTFIESLIIYYFIFKVSLWEEPEEIDLSNYLGAWSKSPNQP